MVKFFKMTELNCKFNISSHKINSSLIDNDHKEVNKNIKFNDLEKYNFFKIIIMKSIILIYITPK